MGTSETTPAARPPFLQTPEAARFIPFAVFLLIGALAGKSFAGAEYWMYAAKTVVVGALLWVWRQRISEMRWAVSFEGIAVGVVIAVLWIGLSGHIPSLEHLWALGREWMGGAKAVAPKPPEVWNPVAYFAGNPALGWGMVAIRVFGRSLVVPALEEVFYRSFAYRFMVRPEFEKVALSTFHLGAFVGTSLLFGLSHTENWLPGVVCGASYQWLVVRRGRLGDAMTAHAVTNLLISGYAIITGRWEFS